MIDWISYRAGVDDTYLNNAIHHICDNVEAFGDAFGNSGKAIRYYGWGWRDVDWSAHCCTLASDDGTSARAGFCESNKWDYEARYVAGDAWDRIRNAAKAIKNASSAAPPGQLIAEMNAALAAGWEVGTARPPARTEPPLPIRYRNWRGEIGDRSIRPIRIYYGTTQWHPDPQWLIEAMDLDKHAIRTFAVRDIVPIHVHGSAADAAGQGGGGDRSVAAANPEDAARDR